MGQPGDTLPLLCQNLYFLRFTLIFGMVPVIYVFDGPQFFQSLEAVPNPRALGGIHKGKVIDIIDFQAEHTQNDFRQIGPQHFRGRIERAAVIVLLGIKADAYSLLYTPAAALSLVRTGTGDTFNGRPKVPVLGV